MNVLRLEDFLDTEERPTPKVAAPSADADLEATRLAGYEAGYQAGWDDALKSSEMEHTHIQAEFARNLEELSFSFFEARKQVCLSLKPLVMALVGQIVPELMRAHYKNLLEEVLLPLVEEQSQPNVDLVCSVEDEAVMKELLSQQERLPVVLRTEPSFSQGQVRFVLGHEIHDVDAEALLSQITEASERFFAMLKEEKSHG
jgi:flagellar assembly protein FliH